MNRGYIRPREPRPVVRGDGRRYHDIGDAALDMVEDGRATNYRAAYNSIRRVCDHRERRVSTCGYGWRWAE